MKSYIGFILSRVKKRTELSGLLSFRRRRNLVIIRKRFFLRRNDKPLFGIFKPAFILLFFLFWLMIAPMNSNAQWVSNLRTKYISIKSDTVLFDTLSTIPKSLYITLASGNVVDTMSYKISYENACLVWNKKSNAYKLIKEDRDRKSVV